MPAIEHEHDWTIALRRKPAGPGNSNHNTGIFEIIYQLCGDDPALDHQEISAKLQQIRGPYTLRAAIPAYLRGIRRSVLLASLSLGSEKNAGRKKTRAAVVASLTR